jgi:hypothetical protein
MADSSGDVSVAYGGSPEIVDDQTLFLEDDAGVLDGAGVQDGAQSGGLQSTRRANAKRMLATGRDIFKGMMPFSNIGTSEHYREARTHYQSLTETTSNTDTAIQRIFSDVKGRIMELLITEKSLDETYLALMATKSRTDASGGAELAMQKNFFDLNHAAYHKMFRKTVIWINMAQAFIYNLLGGQFDPSNPRDFQKVMAEAPAPKPEDTTGEMSNGMIPAVPAQSGGADEYDPEDYNNEDDDDYKVTPELEEDAFGYDAEGGAGFFRKLMGNARDNIKQIAPVKRFQGRNKTWGEDGRETTTHYGPQPNMRHDRIRLINERAYSKWSPCFPERKYIFKTPKKSEETETVFHKLYEEKMSLMGSFVQGEFEYEESRKNGGFYTRPAKDGFPERKVSSEEIRKELSKAINDKNELYGFGWNRMCRINDEVYYLEIMGGVKAPPTMFTPQASEYLDMIATFQKKLREAGVTKKVTVKIMKNGVDTGRTREEERDVFEGYQSLIGQWSKDEYGQNELKGGLLFGKMRPDAIQVLLNAFVECFNGVQRARVIGFCPGKPVTWPGIWWLFDKFPVIGCTLKEGEKTTKNLLNCIKIACPKCGPFPWPPPNPFPDLNFRICPPCECDCDAMWEAINMLELALWTNGDHLSGPNVDKFIKKMGINPASQGALGNTMGMTQLPPASAGIGMPTGQYGRTVGDITQVLPAVDPSGLPHFSGNRPGDVQHPYLGLGAPPAVDPSGLPHYSGKRPGDVQHPYLALGQAPAPASASTDANGYLPSTVDLGLAGTAPAPQPALPHANTAPAVLQQPKPAVPTGSLRAITAGLPDVAPSDSQFGGASKSSMTATSVALGATILAMAFLGAA